MSKSRTEEQKSRRRYLTDCKAKGIKPMQIDYWKKIWRGFNSDLKREFAKKISKPSYKRVKSEKKVCDKKQAKQITKKGRKVIIEHEELVILNG